MNKIVLHVSDSRIAWFIHRELLLSALFLIPTVPTSDDKSLGYQEVVLRCGSWQGVCIPTET